MPAAGCHDRDLAAEPVERTGGRARRERPGPLLLGEHPDPVGALAVVEAARTDRPVAERELGPQVDVDEGVAVRGPGEHELDDAPARGRHGQREGRGTARDGLRLVVQVGLDRLRVHRRRRVVRHRRELGPEPVEALRVVAQGRHAQGDEPQGEVAELLPLGRGDVAGQVAVDDGASSRDSDGRVEGAGGVEHGDLPGRSGSGRARPGATSRAAAGGSRRPRRADGGRRGPRGASRAPG